MSAAVATEQVIEVRHPLVQHKLSYLRDKDTPTVHFRKIANEVTLLLTYEATKDFPTEEVEIETPLERTTVRRILGKKVAVCPVMRAGMGMLDGVLSLVSGARALGLSLPNTATCQELFNSCAAHGGAAWDHSGMLRALEIAGNFEIGQKPE